MFSVFTQQQIKAGFYLEEHRTSEPWHFGSVSQAISSGDGAEETGRWSCPPVGYNEPKEAGTPL